jgi:c(7)-type cytochrome triheme protein
MIKKGIYLSFIILLFILTLGGVTGASVWLDLPSLPPPELYGNIIIDRVSTISGVKPVTFSHWSHRLKHTCRVCHFELEMNMVLNTTMISEELNKHGRYCGACHNGKIAFGHTKEHCDKCHNGDISYGKEKFESLSNLPPASLGNGVDWVKAIEDELIKPENYVLEEYKPLQFERDVTIVSPWAGISPIIFPHVVHKKWLDCSNCHPELFNIRIKGTKNLAMKSILNYEFCGVCHGKVAFPPNDNCKRCHPGMKHPGKTYFDEKVH